MLIYWNIVFGFLLIWYISLIDFQIFNHLCILGINLTWLTWFWYIILVVYCCICFTNILVKIYVPAGYWSVVFLWCLFWHLVNTDLTKWVPLSSFIFWNYLWRFGISLHFHQYYMRVPVVPNPCQHLISSVCIKAIQLGL